MNASPFVINQQTLNSQGNLAVLYDIQERENRIIARIKSKIRRGCLLSNFDLAQIEKFEILNVQFMYQ